MSPNATAETQRRGDRRRRQGFILLSPSDLCVSASPRLHFVVVKWIALARTRVAAAEDGAGRQFLRPRSAVSAPPGLTSAGFRADKLGVVGRRRPRSWHGAPRA